MTKVVKSVYTFANSGRMLLLLIVGSWLIAAGLFALIESTGPLDALYWAMTTMSTVGYGDLSPVTWGGKILTMAFQAWSIFMLVPCAVAHVIDKIRRDEHKFTHDEQEWQQVALEKIARGLDVELPDAPNDTNF